MPRPRGRRGCERRRGMPACRSAAAPAWHWLRRLAAKRSPPTAVGAGYETAPRSASRGKADTGGERAAMIYTLIETAKLKALEPYRYLADVLGRIAAHPMNRHRRAVAVERGAGIAGNR